ncbi:MAG: hypothetical protein ACJ8EL_14570 [Rhizomicrobium sp.]
MQKVAQIAVAATAIVSMSLPGVMVAQNAPATEGGTTTAPAATTQPTATTTTPAAASSDATTTEKAAPKKKKKPAKMTRQREIDKSIDSGTVPARYRRSVPKQYQQYIPFERQ